VPYVRGYSFYHVSRARLSVFVLTTLGLFKAIFVLTKMHYCKTVRNYRKQLTAVVLFLASQSVVFTARAIALQALY